MRPKYEKYEKPKTKIEIRDEIEEVICLAASYGIYVTEMWIEYEKSKILDEDISVNAFIGPLGLCRLYERSP